MEQSKTKFMVNILKEPRHRERYIKMLKSITTHPFVTYSRIILGVFGGVLILLLFAILIMQPPVKLKYTGIFVVLFTLGAYTLLFIYLIPRRNTSLVTVASRMLIQDAFNRVSATRSQMPSLGVADVKVREQTGETWIHFENGDVGVMYQIDGGIGISTLPAVAEGIRSERYKYLIGRRASCQETLVIDVVTARFTEQLIALRALRDRFKGSSSEQDRWRSYMAELHYNFIYDNMRDNDTLIQLFLVLRDKSDADLIYSKARFEGAVAGGMLARANLLGKADIERVLCSLTCSAGEFASYHDDLSK